MTESTRLQWARSNTLEHPTLRYEAAWAALEASDPFRDKAKDGERGLTLRKLIMDSTETGRVDFDILCDRLIANMPKHWIVSTQPRSAQDARGPNDAGAS